MQAKKKAGICVVCSVSFNYYPSEQSGKYCSKICAGKVCVKNLGTRMLGKRWRVGQHEKFRAANSGERHWNWAGNYVSYKALHLWVERIKGKPKRCEICGTTDPDVKYEWANISREYRRDLSDFFGLCKPCHAKYDKKPPSKKMLDHLARIRDATKVWHRSPEGHVWHREHARKLQFGRKKAPSNINT